VASEEELGSMKLDSWRAVKLRKGGAIKLECIYMREPTCKIATGNSDTVVEEWNFGKYVVGIGRGLKIFILSGVYGSMTNNNGFWIR
jgi:hypothetical protein